MDSIGFPLVVNEVKRQIHSMQALDEGEEPNFKDADYNLAAYAAALKVLTQFGKIDGKDVEHEVFAVRDKKTKSDFQIVIERALGIACSTLVPAGLEPVWRDLSLVEQYYLRGLDIESRGERRQGMYEELARGFGVSEIKPMLKSDKANGARMHTANGFADKLLETPKDASNENPAPRQGTASSHPSPSSHSATSSSPSARPPPTKTTPSPAAAISATASAKPTGSNANASSTASTGSAPSATPPAPSPGKKTPKPSASSKAG